MKIKEVSVKNIKLFFIGYYKMFTSWHYSKVFRNHDIATLMNKAATHAPCVIDGTMKCCGCDTIPKLMAGGECKFKKCSHDSIDI